jgi:hypothetical protein
VTARAALAFVTLAACGGRVLESEAADAGVPDARPGESCPVSLPSPRGACAPAGLVCEYGNDLNPRCNPRAVCVKGVWQVARPAESTCPTAVPPSDPGCPPAFPPQENGACGPVAITCFYPNERACTCEAGQLACDAVPPWCPTPRPRLGTPCAVPSQAIDPCFYACHSPFGSALLCLAGTWHEAADDPRFPGDPCGR